MEARRALSGVARVDLSRWPLVGRDDELVLATSALTERGSVVLTGAAGVGKTRLAREVLARVARGRDGTRWVTATQSAATVPLGPVAHLVPDAAIGRGRDATLRGIVRALRRDDGERLLLGVDDAHLLDDASAALIQLLVAGGTASAVVTVRSGEPAPDAITSLWKDGPAPLVALQPLARAEVETVVTTVLDGQVDGATLRYLWEASAGNALFLRELVHHGTESAALGHEQGMWRWHGSLALGERLHGILEMRMGALDDDEREALELIALGQPLSVDCLRWLGVADLVAPLQRRGLLESQRLEDGVALAHPLFGEILRECMPSTRRDAVLLELADAVEATCDGSPAERFRIALWRVDAGDHARPAEIRAAATRALHLWEPRVAERLARAALEAGPEIEAAYLLGGALSDQNRADEALDALRTARSLPGPERLRALIAADEAGVLSHQLGRLAEGERVLSETLEELSDPEARALVEGARAAIFVSTGHATTGEPAPVTSGVPTAVLAAVIEHATAGRLDLAVRLASECLTAAAEWSDEFAAIELFLQLTQAWALVLRGDLRDAQARADAAYADALEHRSDFPRVTWSFVRGIVFVARGLPNSASHALREAIGGFELADRGFLRPSHAYLAMATALAGDGAASERHVRAAHDAKSSFEGLFAVDLGRAGAWSSAARRELTTAATEAKLAAEHAAERHAYALEVLALHDAARFGRPADVVDRIETLTTLVDGALAACVADHVRALVDSDGAALDEASHSFSALTLDLFAAEASAAAARAHRRAGRRSSAFAALERARELTARCESPQTPTLEWADQPEDLTAREREIAELAAADMPSREIAERLGITTRTVDNLLGRVYAKFGISGRHELADLLGTRPNT